MLVIGSLKKFWLSIIIISTIIISAISCEDYLFDNPYDSRVAIDDYVPDSLSAENVTLDRNKLVWTAAKKACEEFIIDRQFNGGPWKNAYAKVPGDQYEWIDSNLAIGFNYNYRISAQYGEKTTPYSDTVKTKTSFPPPSNIEVEKLSEKKYRLTWEDNSVGEDGFYIDRRINNEEWQKRLAHVDHDTTVYVDTNALANKSIPVNLQYRVYAYYGDELSELISTNTNAALIAPSDLTADIVPFKSVTLSWKDNSIGEDSFVVEKRIMDAYEEIGRVIEPVFMDNDITVESENVYKIYSVVEDFSSSVISFSYDAHLPRPDGFAAHMTDYNTIELSWEPVSNPGIEGYKIERGINDVDTEVIATVQSTEYDDNNFPLNETVYYIVYTYYGDNKSSINNDLVNTNILAPQDFSATFNEDLNEVTLTWDYGTQSPESFVIDRKVDQNNWDIDYAVIDGLERTFLDTVDMMEFDYTFRIKASTGNQYSDALTESLKGMKLDLVNVNGGVTFQMGCSDEQEQCFDDEYPAHDVIVDNFQISTKEITNYQYSLFLNYVQCSRNGFYNHPDFGTIRLINPERQYYSIKYIDGAFVPFKGEDDKPVTGISWYSAYTFCASFDSRLPTEAEWEYAARGGAEGIVNPTLYSGSNDPAEVSWHFQTADEVMAVGQLQPNELGIYDMSGNAWEWCNDWYQEDYYEVSSTINPPGPVNGENKVIRGGCYYSHPSSIRVANRYPLLPTNASQPTGFRVAR